MGRGRDRRAEIIQKAARVFLEMGYDAASMNQISEEAKVTKPGFYYHFESKQELLFAIMSMAMDQLEAETREASVQATDSLDQLRRILYCHARMITGEEDGAFTLLTIDETRALRPEDQRTITRRKRAYFDQLRALLETLRAEGRLRPVDATVGTFGVLGLVLWISKWFEPGGRLSADEVANQITEMAMAAVVAGYESPQSS